MSISKREKIIYSILKEVESGNKNLTHEDYDIEFDLFWDISIMIRDAGLLKGVRFTLDPRVAFENSQITFEGLNYLKSNSALSKTYKGLKAIREWLPL
ncbi:YjcQ family protein [Ruminiclostridium cellulolyticum]|uniref:YjcQ protein n=1 Tax=Ruminiclostridium cellulolyticum (strain ATCC 35319 / DSM 5812 / JCM 6584 / H10) TaxID=394503 RepID=B8I8U0_RUMCH|nr:YjcQ family protein [Ruminiclostridium cellulolyticum]ACL77272.1 conserved hypothetical protein [Ruminiclostridium cellulolyticum H10]